MYLVRGPYLFNVEYWCCCAINLMTWCYQVHPFRYRIQVYTHAEYSDRLMTQKLCYTSGTQPSTKITSDVWSVNTTRLNKQDWADKVNIVNGPAKMCIWIDSICRRNIHPVRALLYFAVVMYWPISHSFFRSASLALEQYYDCPIANEATVTIDGKSSTWIA